MDTQQQKSLNVLVVGDSCLDVYHYGACDRLSPEAPVPVLKLTHTERKEGMALNVKKNLESFEIEVDILTNHQTITKERFIDIKTKNHLLRFDSGEAHKLKSLTFLETQNIDYEKYDAIAIVDYNKGFIDNSIAMCISKKATEHSIPLFVDSKRNDLSCYSNSIIKINTTEASKVVAFPNSYNLIVTQGDQGACHDSVLYKSRPVEVYDVCGAGDTFFAALIYKYIISKSYVKAIKYANECARITVMKSGVYALTKEDIKNVDIC